MDHEVPDPWPEDNPSDLTFDPDRPRFADVPLLRVRDGEIEFVRGHLPEGKTTEHLRQEAASYAEGVTLGLFPDGSLYASGEEIAGDARIHKLIAGPRVRLSGRDLSEVADALRDLSDELREHATRLEQLQEQGWRLIDTDALDVYVVNMKYREQAGG